MVEGMSVVVNVMLSLMSVMSPPPALCNLSVRTAVKLWIFGVRLVYSAGSGVNRVQVALSGFSKRLFCFVQTKTLCRYGCMYFLAALVLVCVDVIVMSSA